MCKCGLAQAAQAQAGGLQVYRSPGQVGACTSRAGESGQHDHQGAGLLPQVGARDAQQGEHARCQQPSSTRRACLYIRSAA